MISLSLIVGVYAVFYILYVYVLIPTFLSPLSKIPNAHFTSSFSPLWILYKRYKEQELKTIHAAHTRHGNIVRLGPNEVSVNCVDEGIRTVYGGGFEKWHFYPNLFDNFGVPNMFSTAKSKPHSARKRLISNVYSKSYLQSSPELHTISQVMLFDRLLPILESASAKEEPLDVLELNFSTTMDFVNAFIFGIRNGSNFLQDVKTRQHWLKVYRSRRPFQFWDGELPSLTLISSKIGFPVVPPWVKSATQEIENWALGRCRAAEESKASPSRKDDEGMPYTAPLVYDKISVAIQASSIDDPSTHPHELQVATELLDHLAAGQETSGITLTYLFHELSRNPSLQAALRAELLGLSPGLRYPPSTRMPELPSSRAVDSLPILHACLMETLRLHAAIPGPQPRITPGPPLSLAGSPPLSPGVRVSAQAYSLHRNPDVFPEPEIWKPARWLDPSDERKSEMARWFWAFGSGGRMCLGSNFAIQEMKLITAAIYTNYTTDIVDEEGIEQIDAYVAGPKSNRLILQFKRPFA